MLRFLGGLTLALCVACSAAFAAEADKAREERRRDRVGRVERPGVSGTDFAPGRPVMIEVLIVDVRRGEAGKGDASDPPGDPKTRIEQLDKAGKLDGLTRVELTAVENQPASLHVGQRVPRITASQRGPAGQTNSVTFENVGLRLGIMAASGPRRADRIARPGRPLASRPRGRRRADLQAGRRRTRPHCGDRKPSRPKPPSAARDGQCVLVGAQQLKRQGRQSELLIVVTPRLLAGGDAAREVTAASSGSLDSAAEV